RRARERRGEAEYFSGVASAGGNRIARRHARAARLRITSEPTIEGAVDRPDSRRLDDDRVRGFVCGARGIWGYGNERPAPFLRRLVHLSRRRHRDRVSRRSAVAWVRRSVGGDRRD